MYFQRISDLRQDHDLTQQQVADILHCKREVYRRYEKGIREIPVSYAIMLAQYYHVSLDYLLGLKDTKN
ncbi:MAG: helix-turn-helix transcriptional regulator [Lachnospiraceae bacterium]|nr:helix-turn-helix transcriptional regulator [bacterium]MDY5516056.1 helix-turn-helix transcriptional regulator [Lachnospiraceae bacterium]